jgi:polysaccharide export outer membrane protein
MVKAIWAVACSIVIGGGFIAHLTGCASAPPKGSAGDVPGTALSAGESAPGQVIIEHDVKGIPAGVPVSISPSAAPGPQYRIGPEDLLFISVWENKELTIEVVVRPDGMISLPLIQDTKAEGLTAVELAADIQNKLLAYMKFPQVFVVVKQANSPKYYIIGNVAKPGVYPLRGEISVLQALSIAGGFGPFASPRKIKIVRNFGGKQEVRKVNYYDILDDGTGNFLLKSGDTLVVP